MYTKDGWLTAKGVTYFFVFILVSVILATLSSCNSENDYYYLQVNDYNEESVCVNIIDKNDEIIIVLDKDIDIHKNPEEIINQIDTHIGFKNPLRASEMYWTIVK